MGSASASFEDRVDNLSGSVEAESIVARLERPDGLQIPLGEITIGKFLGEGGFGVVHEAAITGIKFNFAIKFFDPSPFNSEPEAARARFFQEAEVLFKLRHPRIVAIYGVGEHEGRPFILMERFVGHDLYRAREALGAPDPDLVLPFFEFMADALGHAHLKDIVHRDIKPRNLMTIKGDGRVLDFGIAALIDPDGARLTRTGGTCVGDAFSAPELIENPRLRDPRCDVYSLGACWFWLLTGKVPKGLNWEAALRSSVKVSPDYERVLLRCLDQVNSRYATMEELASEIRAIRAGDMPRASADALTDDDVLVLGTVASACPTHLDVASFYHVEQELKGATTRLALGVAYRRLVRFNLITESTDTDFNGNESIVLRLSPQGEHWTESNQKRIAALIQSLKPARPAASTKVTFGDDDIPF